MNAKAKLNLCFRLRYEDESPLERFVASRFRQVITVVAATSFKIDEHAIAIARTASILPFPTNRLLLAPTKPEVAFGGEWRNIPEWMPTGRWNLKDYSRFVLKGLTDYIATEFVLIVQWDGYGVNRDKWSDQFLDYDYIGAPWPPWRTSARKQRVGNGGFSLRSKHWLEAGKSAPTYDNESEDLYCCEKYLAHYLDLGLKVAPLDVAIRFSFEHYCPEFPTWRLADSFGFHGWFGTDRNEYKINVDGIRL